MWRLSGFIFIGFNCVEKQKREWEEEYKVKACNYTMEKANKAIHAIKELLGE